jgi:hypothetical protein
MFTRRNVFAAASTLTSSAIYTNMYWGVSGVATDAVEVAAHTDRDNMNAARRNAWRAWLNLL